MAHNERHASGDGKNAATPFISVFVPARDESRYIERTLEQLRDQDYPNDRYEILVIDGGSRDDTVERVRDFRDRCGEGVQLRLLDNPRRICSAAHNIAIEHGRGDYFLLIDAHVYIPSRTLLSDMAAAVVDHGMLVLGRPQPFEPPDMTYVQRCIALARSCALGHSPESLIHARYEGWASPISIGAMYHRSVFRRIGLYDTEFSVAEDLEINYRAERAGLSCLVSPKFAVLYYPRESIGQFMVQMYRYGRGRAQFLIKHPRRTRPEVLAPPLSVLAVPLLGLASITNAAAAVMLAVLFSMYTLLLLAETFRQRSHPWNQLLTLPLLVPLIHLCAGTGMLREVLWTPLRRSLQALRALRRSDAADRRRSVA